ncbi:PilZ domain-containing protein [Rhizobium wuzhouense]|uniref:Pilus assembly protein PilZ n=1 Tax=Rhizobium wuzhouense TaxID=1986026 RepID=A0ABX5NPA6_9HYPH|nr:PilZ domain-containing protein [Rhizobium wuzhouense]PYB71417.1 pilus assembly protein PilZ [Rhizobium wuzhouense]
MLAIQQSADGRRAQRIRCHIRATLQFLTQKLDCRIIDISRTGMAVQLHGWIEAKRGSTIILTCPELGHVECSVRWYRAGKMGLEFEQTSNMVAQITAYFRNFHRDPKNLRPS